MRYFFEGLSAAHFGPVGVDDEAAGDFLPAGVPFDHHGAHEGAAGAGEVVVEYLFQPRPVQRRVAAFGVEAAQPSAFGQGQDADGVVAHDVVSLIGPAPPPGLAGGVGPTRGAVAVQQAEVVKEPPFHEQYWVGVGNPPLLQGGASGGQAGGCELSHQLVHFDAQGIVAPGRPHPRRPGGAVFFGEVEFAGHFQVQGAAAVEVVDEEVEFAHRLSPVLKLDAVGAEGKVRAGFQPKGDQGFEVFAQQLSAGFQDVRRKRTFAHGQFRGPLLKQRQVSGQGVAAPPIVEDLEVHVGVVGHEWCRAHSPTQPHQSGQRLRVFGQGTTPSFEPRVLHGCEILPSRSILMRTVAQISHRAMRIVIQEWNEKYHVQYVWGPLEQTYRLPVEGAGGLAAVEAFAQRLIPQVEQQFLQMKAARAEALQAGDSTPPKP